MTRVRKAKTAKQNLFDKKVFLAKIKLSFQGGIKIMSRQCYICRKKTMHGSSISRRGKAKKEGGVGIKTTNTTKRIFMPNLQKRSIVVNGEKQKILVCAKCLKANKLKVSPAKKV